VPNDATEKKKEGHLAHFQHDVSRYERCRHKTHNNPNWTVTPLLFQTSTPILTMLF